MIVIFKMSWFHNLIQKLCTQWLQISALMVTLENWDEKSPTSRVDPSYVPSLG